MKFFGVHLQKGTKNALETGRTFATLFTDVELRYQLVSAHSPEEFKSLLWDYTKELAVAHSTPEGVAVKRKESQTAENPHIAPVPEEVGDSDMSTRVGLGGGGR